MLKSNNLIRGAAIALAALLFAGIFALGCKVSDTYKIECVCTIKGNCAIFTGTDSNYRHSFVWEIDPSETFVDGAEYTLIMSSNGTDSDPTDDIIKEIH